MPYDLPFLTTGRRKFKREADRTRTEEIARRQERQERFQAAIARAGFAPPETGIPEFMPGITPKPRLTPEQHRVPPGMVGPAFAGLAAPFDVFSETAAEIGAQVPKLFTGRFGEIEAPTAVTQGLGEALGQFRERGFLSQLGLSLADPFSGPAAGVAAFRAARGAIRFGSGLVKAQVARAAAERGRSVLGREAVAYGPDPNKTYRMRYRVVDIEDLVPSHTDAFAPNPEYPSELQPRIRERGAARLSIQKMSRELVPESLIQDSQALDRGPAIIGPDNVIESGNGRILALRLAQQTNPERWQAYQRALRDSLPQFGVEESQLAGIQNPVLVRERISDVDRVRFAAEANQPAVAVFSPLENAVQDARHIQLDNLIVPEATQSLDVTLRTPTNRPFIAGFLNTLPENERLSLVDAAGDLNLLGVQRVKAAMFARTYPGAAGRRLTQIFFESREPLIRNIEEGMMASLPQVARSEDLVRTGQRAAELSIGEDLAASLDMLARVRARKLTVEEYLGQIQMFERELTPFQEQLLRHMDTLARSPRKVREFLGAYADRVAASPHPQQSGMFAGNQLTKEELFNATLRGQTEGALFAQIPTAPSPEAPATGRVAQASGLPQAEVIPTPQVQPQPLAAEAAAGITRMARAEAAAIRLEREATRLRDLGGSRNVRQAERLEREAARYRQSLETPELPATQQRALPETLPELYRLIEANEGPIAANFVKALHRAGIDTIETHAGGKGFSVRVVAISDANKRRLAEVSDVLITVNPKLSVSPGFADTTITLTNTPAGLRNAARVLTPESAPITNPFSWSEGISPISPLDREAADLAALPTEDRIALETERAAGQRALPEAVVPPSAPPAAAAGPPTAPPARAGRPPAAPPPPPPARSGGLNPEPPSGRPRTLLDLNREAKGMRALTPEQRASVMDAKKPVGDVLYEMRPHREVDALLGPDTLPNRLQRAIPGLRQLRGLESPAKMGRGNPIQMIGVRNAMVKEIERGRARFAGLAWWNDAEELLGFKRLNGTWRATKVAVVEGAKTLPRTERTILDLVEHPERYTLTAEQVRILGLARDTQTKILRDAQRAGVDVLELSTDYWRRIVVKGPRRERILGAWFSKRRGSRKGYTHQRAFQDIDEGTELGWRYETHPLRTFVSRLEAGIDTIADQQARRELTQLAGIEKPLERLAARYPNTIEGVRQARAVRDAAKKAVVPKGGDTPENVLALRQAEADYVTAMRDLYVAKESVRQPGFYELALPNGRIAPSELVEQVNKYLDLPELRRGQGAGALAVVDDFFRLSRSILTTVDVAAGFIQGQSLFYRNNIAWWKAQAHGLVSIVDDPTAYVARNKPLIDQGVVDGAITAPSEFLFARGGLFSLPTKVPLVGPVLSGFQRVFEWFILVGQTELYKAGRSRLGISASREELVSLGSAIRKGLGTESYAILGVRPTQQTAEALTLFAARFFRANTGILAQSFTTGAGGAEARRLMGSLLAGGTALTLGVHYALTGKLPNLEDPFAPDWMQVPIGKTNFNAFGPFYPYFRTLARMAAYNARGEPDRAANELKRFFSSKASLAVRSAEIGTNLAVKGEFRTFEEERITASPGALARGLAGELTTPISAQEISQGLREGRPEALAEIIGLVGRASPFSQMDLLFQKAGDINPEGKSLRDAEPWQRDEMEQRFPDIAERMLATARGVFGDAQRLWSAVDATAYLQEEALEGAFESGATTGDAFRMAYQDIQAAKAKEKAGINRTLHLFQDAKKLPDDANDRAVAQYYLAQQKATQASGVYNFNLAEQLMADLDREWTPEQKGYVERNTGRATHPPLISDYRNDVQLLKPYWDIEERFIATLPPQAQTVWKSYRGADPSEQPALARAVRPIIEALGGMRQKYRAEHEDTDVALVKWGYQGQPMTEAGRRLQAKKLTSLLSPVGNMPPAPMTPTQQPIIGGSSKPSLSSQGQVVDWLKQNAREAVGVR